MWWKIMQWKTLLAAFCTRTIQISQSLCSAVGCLLGDLEHVGSNPGDLETGEGTGKLREQ